MSTTDDTGEDHAPNVRQSTDRAKDATNESESEGDRKIAHKNSILTQNTPLVQQTNVWCTI